MPSTTYVCFDCRTTKRSITERFWHHVSYAYPSLTCQHCRGEMKPLSSSHAIPKKSDDKAWRALMQHVSQLRIKQEAENRWRNHNRCVRLRDEAQNSTS
ncbi:hypothetical protein VPHD485_0294 [Vibrio phage D485]